MSEDHQSFVGCGDVSPVTAGTAGLPVRSAGPGRPGGNSVSYFAEPTDTSSAGETSGVVSRATAAQNDRQPERNDVREGRVRVRGANEFFTGDTSFPPSRLLVCRPDRLYEDALFLYKVADRSRGSCWFAPSRRVLEIWHDATIRCRRDCARLARAWLPRHLAAKLVSCPGWRGDPAQAFEVGGASCVPSGDSCRASEASSCKSSPE